jgi:acetylornithine deacetylase/succinyl-diaminopimelate desuccinylase-like protein
MLYRMLSQRYSIIVLAALSACPSLFAADKLNVDWKKQEAEIFEHYSNLIKLDTSNPPGNETLAANYLKGVLDREGIPAQVYELEKGRGNVVARLKGNGSKKPLLVMGHLDVVGVQRDKWTIDPFSATRKDGFIYGRGSIDDKDKVTSALMVILLLKRMKVPLDRDVIFLGEAGEEGSSNFGIGFMVKEHWPEIEAEYAITEGGMTGERNGKVRYVQIGTTEKVGRGVTLVSTGQSGHASRPRPDNPVLHLAQAVSAVASQQPPMHLTDTTRAYFERLATVSTPEEADRYNHITDPVRGPAILAYLAEHEPRHSSMLRTTIAPTIIKAGFRSNVVPSEAEATLDIRALPDEDMPRFYDYMNKLIHDPQVKIVSRRDSREVSPPSRFDTEMFHSFEAATKTMFPGAITLPTMGTGGTDNAQLRARGVQAYGFGPIIDESDEGGGGAHADDEHLKESALYKEVEFLWRSVAPVVATK